MNERLTVDVFTCPRAVIPPAWFKKLAGATVFFEGSIGTGITLITYFLRVCLPVTVLIFYITTLPNMVGIGRPGVGGVVLAVR